MIFDSCRGYKKVVPLSGKVNCRMFFEQTIIAVVVGWSLGTASTWLILAKPWLDKRLLKKSVTIQQPAQQQNQQGPAQVKIV